jgi:Domain of unknown function (DUF4440)
MQSKTNLLSAVFSLTLILLAGCAGEPRHPTWKSATGSEQHERLMWQAMKGQQWKDVENHLAPTFVGVDAAGKKYDRPGWMAYWKSERFSEYSLGEVTVNPAGPDMVVSYVLNISGNAGGSVGPNQPLRVVSVWQPLKSGWTLTATSLTPIRE